MKCIKLIHTNTVVKRIPLHTFNDIWHNEYWNLLLILVNLLFHFYLLLLEILVER